MGGNLVPYPPPNVELDCKIMIYNENDTQIIRYSMNMILKLAYVLDSQI